MNDLVKSFKEVFSKTAYLALATLVALVIFLAALWLPNLTLLKYVLISDNFSLAGKLEFIIGSLALIKTNFSLAPRIFLVLISVLTGVNLSLFVYYLKQRSYGGGFAGLGFLGVVSAVLGVGCLSCGSIILTTVLGLSATLSVLGHLPFAGREFGVIGILLLTLSIYLLAKKIQSPLVCKIKK